MVKEALSLHVSHQMGQEMRYEQESFLLQKEIFRVFKTACKSLLSWDYLDEWFALLKTRKSFISNKLKDWVKSLCPFLVKAAPYIKETIIGITYPF